MKQLFCFLILLFCLALGLNVVEGKVTYKAVADVFGLEYEPIEW